MRGVVGALTHRGTHAINVRELRPSIALFRRANFFFAIEAVQAFANRIDLEFAPKRIVGYKKRLRYSRERAV